MGVYMKLLLRLSLIFFTSMFLVSCANVNEVSKIEVVSFDSSQAMFLDQFELSDITLRVTYIDGKFFELPLEESMI